MNLKKFLVDLFFPVECLGCNSQDEWLCEKCFNKIKINFDDSFHKFSRDLDGVWVTTDYRQDILIEVLHNFKYNSLPDLGNKLAELLNRFLEDKIRKAEITNFDLVLAIPLAKKRKLWRGFNQSEILAEIIACKFNWNKDFNLIFRRYHTCPQVSLKAAERKINVKGIFRINNPKQLKNKKILLIDDVITTGATMNECAKILKEAGAKEVWGLVLAKG